MKGNEMPTERTSDFGQEAWRPQVPHWMGVVSHLDPRYGGLSAVVPQLSSSIVRTGLCTMELSAFCTPTELYCESNHPELSVTTWPTSRAQWWRDRSLRIRFQEQVRKVDGLHIHGLWEQSTAIAAHSARALRKPYVISAHGMLEKWALSNKKLKKQIYSAFIERANVQKAACVHALTSAEAEDYRQFGVKSPIAIIPNGVHIPQSIDSECFLSRFPELRGKRMVLFMGRIHFKKGLDILIESWAKISRDWPDAYLVLAGPDFEDTRAVMEKLVADQGIGSQVLFTGMLRNEIKWSALAHAECFVLPSYSEGLSVSVLEAMGMGLPVIVTEQCNIPEVGTLDAGWLIKSETAPLTSSLRDLLSNSPAHNGSVGAKGRILVQERYNWETITSQMVGLYRWIDGGCRPQEFDFVTT